MHDNDGSVRGRQPVWELDDAARVVAPPPGANAEVSLLTVVDQHRRLKASLAPHRLDKLRPLR